MPVKRLSLFLATNAVFVSLAIGQPDAKPILIEHARVFDGDRTLENTSVLVKGGVIAAVGTDLARPADATVVDATGKTLLPGLIDAHTHTIGEDGLRQAPIFGVTTDLDMFTDPKIAASIKQREHDGKLPDYTSLFSAGYLATVPGGHGTEYGIPVPTLTRPDEAQAWVDARIAEGSDYIKIIYDDALEYGSAKPTPTLSKETMRALVDAAHKRGKLAVVHIGSLDQALAAINAGADGLAHLFVGPQSVPDLGRMAEAHHMFVVPTLTVLNTICGTNFDGVLADDPRLKPYLPSAAIGTLKAHFGLPKTPSCQAADEAVQQLKAAHVPILAGTDAGNPGTTQGASLHGELELLVRAGLTPSEALHAATAAPAAAFHLDDRGQIAVGKRADLLLVNGDPTADIRQTRDIDAVWEAGYPIDRAKWKTSVAQQVEEETRQKTAPPPAGSESGWISDFEQEGAPQAKFGSGWMISTDQMMGGKSTAKMAVAAGGAEGSKNALRVTGDLAAGSAVAWAGVMFSPGATPMAPANLSSHKAIRFWVKGDGRTYQLMLFSKRLGYRPAVQTFVAGPDWKPVTLSFAAFGVADPNDIMGILWSASQPGAFTFDLDNIRLE
jgi:imidazolonepropionase-like amidohydrolase